jgi:CHASE2 domain-containing sensor protein
VSELPRPKSFRRHLVRALPVFLSVTLITLVLEHVGWLRGFETAALDTSLRLIKPITPRFVQIVSINEDDYVHIFQGRSPLDPEKVKSLIEAIADGGPRVIGVDIDTSDPQWKEIAPNVVASLRGRMSIVWEREAIGDKEPLTTLEILGGAKVTPEPSSGIAGVFQDWDGVVRRYQRHFQTKGDKERTKSLPWAIVTAFCEASPESERLPGGLRKDIDAEARRGRIRDEERLLNFSGDRYAFRTFAASFVLSGHEADWWKEKSPFRDKIVLLGGSYRTARDIHMTPLGVTTGVELGAQAVESELQGSGIHEVNKLLMILFDFVAWIALVAIYYFCRLAIALWISLVGIPILSLMGSLFAFSSLAYWADFAPIIIGVLIHQLYDHASEYRRLLKQAQGKTTI